MNKFDLDLKNRDKLEDKFEESIEKVYAMGPGALAFAIELTHWMCESSIGKRRAFYHFDDQIQSEKTDYFLGLGIENALYIYDASETYNFDEWLKMLISKFVNNGYDKTEISELIKRWSLPTSLLD